MQGKGKSSDAHITGCKPASAHASASCLVELLFASLFFTLSAGMPSGPTRTPRMPLLGLFTSRTCVRTWQERGAGPLAAASSVGAQSGAAALACCWLVSHMLRIPTRVRSMFQAPVPGALGGLGGLGLALLELGLRVYESGQHVSVEASPGAAPVTGAARFHVCSHAHTLRTYAAAAAPPPASAAAAVAHRRPGPAAQ